MIKNERQYRTTQAQAEKLKKALAHLGAIKPSAGVHPVLHKAQKEAMQSQLEDLRTELRAYESLNSGRVSKLRLHSLDDLAIALIQARLAAGLSQKDLAERLGIKEQQIQRYEATDYASASLSRVQEVARAIGLKLTGHASVA